MYYHYTVKTLQVTFPKHRFMPQNKICLLASHSRDSSNSKSSIKVTVTGSTRAGPAQWTAQQPGWGEQLWGPSAMGTLCLLCSSPAFPLLLSGARSTAQGFFISSNLEIQPKDMVLSNSNSTDCSHQSPSDPHQISAGKHLILQTPNTSKCVFSNTSTHVYTHSIHRSKKQLDTW